MKQLFVYARYFGCCLLMVLAGPAFGQVSGNTTGLPLALALQMQPANAERFELPFSRFLGSDQPVRLRGISDELVVALPLTEGWKVQRAAVRLNGVASQALNEHSQLVVSLNGRVVRQIRFSTLQDDQRRFREIIELPVELLEPGFNQVQFAAIQHYTDICEYPNAPQLWTDIDVASSSFSLLASRADAEPSLQLLASLFDRTTWHEQPEVAVFAPMIENPQLLAALGKVAQGIGQRYDYVPVRISAHRLPASLEALESQISPTASAAIILGTRELLRPLLGDSEIRTGRMPGIGVIKLPSDANRFLVVLTGDNFEQLHQASSVFAIPGVPWPDRAWALVSSLDIPAPESLEQRFSIPTQGQGAFPLRAIGYQSRTVSSINAASVFLPLWNNTWQGRAQIRAHLAYSSGLDSSSAMAIYVNGVMQGQIPLNNADGGSYEGYTVTIPSGAMKTGWNQLEFRPLLVPAATAGNCLSVFSDNLSVTLYEDTVIQKFGGSQLQRTDLSKISGQGSLYVGRPFGQDIGFHLTHLSEANLSAGLTLVSKISQVYARPLLSSWFGVGENPDSDFHYWIGPYLQLPDSVRNNMASSIPYWVEFEVPMVRSAQVQVAGEEPWYFRVLSYFNLRKIPAAETTSITLSLQEVFDRQSFAVSTRDSLGEEVIAFTAPDEQALNAGIDRVIGFGHWGQLRGQMAFWEPDGDQLYALTSDDAPFSAYGLRGGLGLWVSQYPWIAFWALMLAILLLIRTSQVLLNRRSRHRAEIPQEE